MMHLHRALDQARLRIDHVRLIVCTHAHVDHCGAGAADRRARRLRDLDAPEPRAPHGVAPTTSSRCSPAASRSRARAASRRRRCGAGSSSAAPRAAGQAGVLTDRPRAHRRRHRRDRPRRLAGDRDARPRAVAHLPLPARAPAADLRRPPARPRHRSTSTSATRPTRSASSSPRSTRSTGSTAGSRCPATAARSPTCRATSPPTARSSPSGWRRSRPRCRAPRTRSRSTSTASSSTRRRPPGCSPRRAPT